MLKTLIHNMNLKNALGKWFQYLPGANEFKKSVYNGFCETVIILYQHIEPCIQQATFCRWHVQMHIFELNISYLIQNIFFQHNAISIPMHVLQFISLIVLYGWYLADIHANMAERSINFLTHPLFKQKARQAVYNFTLFKEDKPDSYKEYQAQ